VSCGGGERGGGVEMEAVASSISYTRTIIKLKNELSISVSYTEYLKFRKN